jgi:hypothetical protein
VRTLGKRIELAWSGTVTAALQQIVDRASSDPEEAAEFGPTDGAVTALTTFLSSLTNSAAAPESV